MTLLNDMGPHNIAVINMLVVKSEYKSPCAIFRASHCYIAGGPQSMICTLSNIMSCGA